MGTNYYLRTLEPGSYRIHIGKASMGWCFALAIHPHLNIQSLDDWTVMFAHPFYVIVNEYGERHSVVQMLLIIMDRNRLGFDDTEAWWVKNVFWNRGYANDEPRFHFINKSCRGPNGLLRAQIDGFHCVGHGPGTWDLFHGEFS